jgi:uncharacterized membrane protein
MPTEEEFQQLQTALAALNERVRQLEDRLGRPSSPHVPIFNSGPESAPLPRSANWKPAGLESQIGANWFNRIGIVTVLVSVGFFLNYAFESDWVGPAGRVTIGLVLGLAVVFWSEFIRRRGHLVFSYSLKAIGIGVLYLSLWAGSQLYYLIPNVLAWFSMTCVTAATVGLALWQDAEIIAAFATFGAFLTPVMLAASTNNASYLFTYVAILNVGALFLVVFKPWIRVLFGSYAGTLILYASWHYNFYTAEQFAVALTSVSAFFVIFAIAPFIYRQRVSLAVMVLALMNAATYFFELWRLFGYQRGTGELAIISIGLGCVYLLGANRLRRAGVPNLTEIHCAIGAAFLIVAVPVGLHAPWITAAWFVEGAALIWLSPASGKANYLKQLGVLALVLGLIRLVAIDQFNVTRILLNERMLIYALAVGSLAFAARAFARTQDPQDHTLLLITAICINLLALSALTQEITDSWRRQFQACGTQNCSSLSMIRDFEYSALWIAYGAGLSLVGFWKRVRFLRWQALALIGITVGKVFVYDTSSLDRIYRVLSFMFLGFVLLMTSFFYQRSLRAKIAAREP